MKEQTEKPKLKISLSAEHSDRKNEMKKVFGEFDVQFVGDLHRKSLEDLAMQMIIHGSQFVAQSAAWDLFKDCLKRLFSKYPGAGVVIDDRSEKYVIKQDFSVNVIVVPERQEEFSHLEDLGDLVEHLEKKAENKEE